MNNGFFETRDTGLSGYPSRLRFEWWLIEQDVASNRSRIGFKLFGTGGTLAGAWSTLFRAYVNVAGQEWNTGRHNLYNGTVISQGEKWLVAVSLKFLPTLLFIRMLKTHLARLAGICQPFQGLHSRLSLPTRIIRRILTLARLLQST